MMSNLAAQHAGENSKQNKQQAIESSAADVLQKKVQIVIEKGRLHAV